MDRLNNLPYFNNVTSGGLTELSYPDETTEHQLYYQGMSVQTLNSPFSVYFSQPNTDQNYANFINPLNEFRIASLPQANPNGLDELDFPVISQSIFDECVSYHSDNESVVDELQSMLSSYPFNQACLSGNETEIREPTAVNLSNPDDHLTHLPAELSNPQDSRPVAAVNPLNLQQAASDNSTNSAEIVGDKSSQVERQRERRKDPAYAKLKIERYRNDPAYAEGQRIYIKIYSKMKRQNFSREEASKIASVAKKQYLQSLNSPEDSGDLPQTSNPAEATQNSSKNSDALPPSSN